MSDFLASMARGSEERSKVAQQQCSHAEAQERCQDLPATTPFVRAPRGMGVIAEIKVRSPAEGALAADVDVQSIVTRAQDYVDGGASILSVLTEPERFDGCLTYLAAVKAHVGKQAAVMRKDFLTDQYQLYEARLHGADGVLLIARMLDDRQLEHMVSTATELGLFVLLEAFDQNDLQRMAQYAAPHVLLGLNCRDLTTLKINPDRFSEFLPSFPDHAITVAESGLHSVDDAVRIHALGYDMALIGTMLMRASNPQATIHEIRTRSGALT